MWDVTWKMCGRVSSPVRLTSQFYHVKGGAGGSRAGWNLWS